jgi:LPXTG-motif cell wall-anchored protein
MPANGICATGGGTTGGGTTGGGTQLCPNGSAMPTSGNVADCGSSPVGCPAGTVMTAGTCTPPAQGGLAEPVAAPPVVSNGTTAQPVLGPLTDTGSAPGTATPLAGDTATPGQDATALPFTGSNDAQLAAAGALMLLLGGGLVLGSRPRRRGAHAA